MIKGRNLSTARLSYFLARECNIGDKFDARMIAE